MSTPDDSENKAYEARLRRRLEILKKQFDAGKVSIVEDLQVIESLKAIRCASDGSIDLSTVDGRVRSMALAVEFFHDREEMKESASLAEIQKLYFELLEVNFGKFYKIMLARGMTPHDGGIAASNSEAAIKEITTPLPKFLEFLDEFWKQTSPIAHAHVEDMHGTLKGVFGGDLFPSNNENIASKCGIYADTNSS